MLALDPEGLPADGEDGQVRGGVEELGDQLPAGIEDALAAVEDEEDAPAGQPFAQRLDGRARIVVQETDGVGDRGGE
ncbi:hypothetical protein [Streptomyces sp. NPDC055105]|uniref:hypothetical protein n=1 Tax=Streptomyces sp. NPDC055105 TaxID=3365719 RepID=UPI0037D4BAD1